MLDKLDSLSRYSLVPAIERFFQSLTDNLEIIALAVEIQLALEQGHTAIPCTNRIDHKLISSDGCSGYLVHNQNRAGFRRFYQQEQAIMNAFLSSSPVNLDTNAVISGFNKALKTIGHPSIKDMDEQWQACIASLYHPRFVLSGGPGTGKTTTIVRMMLLHLCVKPDLKIMLAAPTGKAANRMMQSIYSLLEQLTIPQNIQEGLAMESKTIHRLLGYNHQNNQVKFNHSHPLPYDLIIIDESSMLDVTMSHCLFQATKPESHLVLLGDKNQLPAVEPGHVFAGLCSLLRHEKKPEKTSPVDYINQFSQQQNAPKNYIQLNKNYRFSEGSLVSVLCKGLIIQKPAVFYTQKDHADFNWTNPQHSADKLEQLSQWYQGIPKSESAILLSAVNHGNNSVNELNDMAMNILYKGQRFHQGIPIMVTKNDYTLNLFNGDIGCLIWQDNAWQVSFDSIDLNEETKRIKKIMLLDAIQSWVYAHAISIHKSQGSEYDHVLIAIPDDESSELLTNSLLYTALSRSKKSITMWSSESILEKIVRTNRPRMTFFN